MRQSLGTAVFSGMIGVALFGIFLTPVFFFVLMWFTRHRQASTAAAGPGDAGGTSLGPAAPPPRREALRRAESRNSQNIQPRTGTADHDVAK